MGERMQVRWRLSAPLGADATGGSSADDALLAEGRRVVRLEAQAVAALEGRLGADFVRACRLVHEARGRVVVSGMGKSGHVARKIAATLTSTGTPAEEPGV